MDSKKLQDAVKLYEDRQARKSHPSGHTDNGGRWYPSADEKCSCCNSLREPSRAYPWSLMVHCRTSIHIEHLMGIPAGSIRAEINRREREIRQAEREASQYAAQYRHTMSILAAMPEVA